MFRAYLRLIVFSLGLLVGIQVPAFVDQYQKRIDAHFREVQKNLSGFQATANKQFKGSIETLIQYYERSPDPVFKSDAKSIKSIHARFTMLQREREALGGPWYRAAFHVAFQHNAEVLEETLAQYSYTVPLNATAIGWGLALWFFSALGVELVVLLLAALLRLMTGVGRNHAEIAARKRRYGRTV